MSRPYTKKEMREMFLDAVKSNARYWADVESDPVKAIEGALFSVMNVIDGTSGAFPAAIDLVLRPHPDNKQFHIDEGEDYVEDGMVINDDCYLHEVFHK